MRWPVAIVNGFVLFCDDVREEKGRKQSLMGLLGTHVQLSKIPGSLPKLCCCLVANIEGSDEVPIEAELSGDFPKLPLPLKQTLRRPSARESRWQLRINVMLVPFAVPKSGAELHAKFTVGDQVFESTLVFEKAETSIGEQAKPSDQ